MQSCYAKNVIFWTALFAAAVCNTDQQIGHFNKAETTKQKPGKHRMIVFVHGTMLPLPNLGTCAVVLNQTFSSDQQSQKSLYQKYLDTLKDKSIFRYQPSGKDGLHLVTDQQSACIAQAMFRQFLPAQVDCYTFTWSGRLNNQKRIQAAQTFYQSLINETERLKKIHQNLEVIVICHSHGGNVGLNLAHVEKHHKKNLCIDKLVLLATPVQSETSAYVTENCFKKVYNFYSHGDMVQKLDFVSTKDHRSSRLFAESPNLVQIELLCGTKQPGHNELWFFGGKNNWLYPHSLSLSPFPFFVFLPIVLEALDEQYPSKPSVTLNVTKSSERMLFSFSDNGHQHTQSIEHQALKEYRDLINSY